MNAPFNPARAQREALYAARVKHMAAKAAEWAERPQDDHAKAAFLDAAAHCIDSDLAEETENTLRECGLDEHGYPLNSYGDTDPKADRVWFPVGDAA